MTELKGEINCCVIIIGDFNNPLPVMDRTSRWKTNKEAEDLNSTIK